MNTAEIIMHLMNRLTNHFGELRRNAFANRIASGVEVVKGLYFVQEQSTSFGYMQSRLMLNSCFNNSVIVYKQLVPRHIQYIGY